ncbi:hypothetical protein Gohar_008171 [Gossypium harknessii]|uniref:Uncharacterized protein n=1 Tax=Gossypium harknessii TaxID=34285 RepID=A0A7J9GK20_9ROSI|nr:hypothetical protein [Gossypium harknessii]
MQERFPELGLVKEDFIEMTWIESVLFMSGLSNETSEALIDRNRSLLPPSFKSKSDYVNEPVPEIALQGLWPQLLEVDEASTAVQTFIAYGGMDETSETETPFPHRKGTLYNIHYNIGWQEEENIRSQRYISWMRKLYSYMGPFVSKSHEQRMLITEISILEEIMMMARQIISKQAFGAINILRIILID